MWYKIGKFNSIELVLSAIIKKILHLCPSDELDLDSDFLVLGLDSLQIVEAAERLRIEIGEQYNIVTDVFFDHPTISLVSKHVQTTIIAHAQQQNYVAHYKDSIQLMSYTHSTSVAIVGMSCDLPASCHTIDKFWSSLIDGEDAVCVIPAHHFGTEFLKSLSRDEIHIAKAACILKSNYYFDSTFFNMSTLEATLKDPHERKLLQNAVKACESSGFTQVHLHNSAFCIFIGCTNAEFDDYLMKQDHVLTPNDLLASGPAMFAGRLAYFLETGGIAMTINSACSSSLVAVDAVVREINTHTSDCGMASGVELMISPNVMRARYKHLSIDSHCKTLDSSADGYACGEGCVSMIMQLCNDHLSDIELATVVHSKINQDSRGTGLCETGGSGQRELLRDIFDMVAHDDKHVGFSELHGIGTSEDDVTEMQAYSADQNYFANQMITVGTVKVNKGHADGASGLMSMAKVLLSLCMRFIPMHRNWCRLNPNIASQMAAISLPVQGYAWDNRHAGTISSFGCSGSNCCLVLETKAAEEKEPERHSQYLLPLSGKTRAAINSMMKSWQNYLETDLQSNALSAVSQVAHRRMHFRHRTAVVADCVDQLLNELQAMERNPIFKEPCSSVCFLYAGPISGCSSFAEELYEELPLFHRSFKAACEMFELEIDIHEPHLNNAAAVENKFIANNPFMQEISLLCLAYSLSELLNLWGIEAQMMIGHCLGEIYAATVSRIIGPLDAAKVVGMPAKIMDSNIGVMHVLRLSLKNAILLEKSLEGGWLACVNGESSVTFTFQKKHAYTISAQIRELGIDQKMISKTGYHSPLMKEVADALYQSLAPMSNSLGLVPVLSNFTGEILQNLDATYCCRQITEHINFYGCVTSALDRGADSFIEIGANSMLLSLFPPSRIKDENILLVPSLKKEKADLKCMLQAAAAFYSSGINLVWGNIFDQESFNHLWKIPAYTFDEQIHKLPDCDMSQKLQIANLLNQGATNVASDDVMQPALSKIVVDENKTIHYNYEKIVESAVREILHIDSEQELSKTIGFMEMGMDSSLAIEFYNKINIALNNSYDVPLTVAFDCPTVEALVSFLENQNSVQHMETKFSNQTCRYDPHDTIISIQGLACNLPNSSKTLADLHESLVIGRDSICDIPMDRYDYRMFYESNIDSIGKMYVNKGAFILESVYLFDCQFFNISPKEAELMDPQQRMLLQTVWHTLENASIQSKDVRSSDMGIFVGNCNQDWTFTLFSDKSVISSLYATSTGPAVLSGRVAYFFGTMGPALTIDTACSSSLVATVTAFNSTKDHTCHYALAAGVDLMFSPIVMVSRCRSRMLSPDCHCKTLDNDADGYARGEGCVTLILVNDLDSEAGTIAVSNGKINQDGPSSGLTAPNGSAQRKIIKSVFDVLQDVNIGCVEMHGTGTSLGDPIEINALQDSLKLHCSKVNISAAKVNVGHTEGSSGMVGMFKCLLAIKMDYITMHRNWSMLNKNITIKDFDLPVEGHLWDTAMMATVSSFGFSGTNCFVLLARNAKLFQMKLVTKSRCVLAISNKSKRALQKSLLAWHTFVINETDVRVFQAVNQASLAANYFEHRHAIVSGHPNDLLGQLTIAYSEKVNKNATNLCYVYTGQTKEYCSLGNELCNEISAYNEVCTKLTNMCELSSAIPDFFNRETIRHDIQIKNESNIKQLSMLCLQYSLSEFLRFWNIEPQMMIGHSLGEISAATVSGMIELQDAVRLTMVRGKVMSQKNGAMHALKTEVQRAHLLIANMKGCWLAAHNSPTDCTLTLHNKVHSIFSAQVTELGILHKRINDYGSHSPLMWEAAKAFYYSLQSITYSPCSIPIFSNVNGELHESIDGSYWCKHITEPVQFSSCVRGALANSADGFLEVGPHPQLLSLISTHFDNILDMLLLPTLTRYQAELEAMLHMAADFYKSGVNVNWTNACASQTAMHCWNVPAYVFDECQYMMPAFNQDDCMPKTNTFIGDDAVPSNLTSDYNVTMDYLTNRNHTDDTFAHLTHYDVGNKSIKFVEIVEAAVRETLNIPEGQQIDRSAGFMEMGMNSLLTIQFHNKLNKNMEICQEIPATIAFDYPTIDALVAFLDDLEAPTIESKAQTGTDFALNVRLRSTISVRGVACNLPNSSRALSHFWDSLVDGKDLICCIPADRFDYRAFYDPNIENTQKMYVKNGAFITEPVYLFDAQFFSISPKEAQLMDPQQRFLLQTTWHCLENASIQMKELAASDTGIFIGCCNHDWSLKLLSGQCIVSPLHETSTVTAILSGRLAYFFGTMGPALVIDTACSSSLVATATAFEAIKRGACHYALAAGVDLMFSPLGMVSRCRSRILSPDCHCKTLDNDADGYVKGEGCLVVVLENNVKCYNGIAEILNGDINQDGHSSGLTAPNGSAQRKIIKSALDVVPNVNIGCVEMHGTGTSLGDPIEINALQHSLKVHCSKINISAAKANVGHAEGSAGLVGMFKCLLAIKMDYITMHRNWSMLNKNITIKDFDLPVEGHLWDTASMATVSSFGFSGTNCFVLLARNAKLFQMKLVTKSRCVLAISNKSKRALQKSLLAWRTFVINETDVRVFQAVNQASLAANYFEHRHAIVSGHPNDLLGQLTIAYSEKVNKNATNLCYVYTGQTKEYCSLGNELCNEISAYNEVCTKLTNMCELSSEIPNLFNRASIMHDIQMKNESDIKQLSILCLQYSISKLLRFWEIEPQMMIGHSLGEISAATVSGMIKLQDAVKLTMVRGKVMSQKTGVMHALKMEVQRARLLIANMKGCWLAAHNSPVDCTFSLHNKLHYIFSAQVSELGILYKRINEYGFHSPLMWEAAKAFYYSIQSMAFSPCTVPLYSNVNGELHESIDAAYWCKHITEPVQFSSCVRGALENSADAFLELGPHPQLLSLISSHFDNMVDRLLLPTLTRYQAELEAMLHVAAHLYKTGFNLNWAYAMQTPINYWKVPVYVFDEYQYEMKMPKGKVLDAGIHERCILIGDKNQCSDQNDTTDYMKTISNSDDRFSYLYYHKIEGECHFPEAGFVEMALEAAYDMLGGSTFCVTNFIVLNPLILVSNFVQLCTKCAITKEDTLSVSIYSVNSAVGNHFKLHAQGNCTVQYDDITDEFNITPLFDSEFQNVQKYETKQIYDLFSAQGQTYGNAFQGITSAESNNLLLCKTNVKNNYGSEDQYVIHPCFLDSFFQSFLLCSIKNMKRDVLFSIQKISGISVSCINVNGDGEAMTQISDKRDGDILGSLIAVNSEGKYFLSIEELLANSHYHSADDNSYSVVWCRIPTLMPVSLFGKKVTLAPYLGDWSPNIASILLSEGIYVNCSTNISVAADVVALTLLSAATDGIKNLLTFFNLSKRMITSLTITSNRLLIYSDYQHFSGHLLQNVMIAAVMKCLVNETSHLSCFLAFIFEKANICVIFTHVFEQSERKVVFRLLRVNNKNIFEELLLPHVSSHHRCETFSLNRDSSNSESSIVSGGLSGIGFHISKEFYFNRKTSLVLFGRRCPLQAIQASICLMLDEGFKISYSLSSITSKNDLYAILNIWDRSICICHSAAVVQDSTIRNMQFFSIKKAILTKAVGALYFHLLRLKFMCDHMVLQSSVSTLFGEVGLSTYSASNSFVDGIANHSAQLGYKTLSIAWGNWAHIGMVADSSEDKFGRKGYSAFSPTDGIKFFMQSFSNPSSYIVYALVDWNKIAMRLRPFQCFLQHFSSSEDSSQKRMVENIKNVVHTTVDRPKALRYAPMSQNYELAVQNAVRETLGIGDKNPVETNVGFMEMGMDSLLSIEFQSRLQEVFVTHQIPATVAFDHPTIDSLVVFLQGIETPEVHLVAEIKESKVVHESQVQETKIKVRGLACNLPNISRSLADLWELLVTGIDTICDIPIDRFDYRIFYDSSLESAGEKMYVKQGAFITEAAYLFDNQFFSISLKEAKLMDPQQRMLMQTTWHCLENASIRSKDIMASDCGIFIGNCNQEWSSILFSDQCIVSPLHETSTGAAMLSGRLAYFFGTMGPALTIDTACSSSLVAIVTAFGALTGGTCHHALTAGVDLLFSPLGMIGRCRSRMLSPDCHCKTLDNDADGYAKGEGCVTAFLESNVSRDIGMAAISNGKINQDGRSSGLTAPNGIAQRDLIKSVLVVIPNVNIGCAEIHGTATSLGDPIEINALQDSFKFNSGPVTISAAKVNMGHTEGSAGLVGMFKAVLAISMNRITMHKNWSILNKHIAIKDVTLPMEGHSWNSALMATVSSFGYSGTNCFVLLDRNSKLTDFDHSSNSKYILAFSNKSQAALRKHMLAWHTFIQNEIEFTVLRAIKQTSVVLTHFKYRHAIVSCNKDDLLARLGITYRVNVSGSVSNPCYVYTGQAKECCSLGNELYHEISAYNEVCTKLTNMCELSSEIPNLFERESIRHEMQLKSESNIKQLSILCLQYSLSELLRFWNIEPQMMIGHSLGEISAATVSGMIELQDAVKLTMVRGKVMSQKNGVMHALKMKVQRARLLIANMKCCWLAAHNSPMDCTLTLHNNVHYIFSAQVTELGILHKRINDYGSHSPLMWEAANALHDSIQSITYSPCSIPIFSNLTGELRENIDAAYWCKHITEPVQFSSCVRGALANCADGFLELGPHPQLLSLIPPHLENTTDMLLLPTLMRHQAELEAMLNVAADLYRSGFNVNWAFTMQSPINYYWNVPAYVFDENLYIISSTTTTPKTPDISGNVAMPNAVQQPKVEQPKSLKYKEALQNYEVIVENAVRETLEVPESQKLERNLGFMEMGMNSLLTIQFRNKLQETLKITHEIPATIAFDCPTIEAVVAFLHDVEVSEVENDAAAEMDTESKLLNKSRLQESKIAIRGLACNLPNTSRDPADLWESLLNGRDCICDIPLDRYDYRLFYDPNLDSPADKMYVKKGAFIAESVYLFDNSFFNISPEEASLMDPQQRMLMQTAFHCLENASIQNKNIMASDTGMFVGNSNQEWLALFREKSIDSSLLGTSTGSAILSGRLAYFFGTMGPALTIDTFCSSSLVATVTAFEAINSNRCYFALAAGVDLIFSPLATVMRCKSKMLSPDCHCKTFDDEADGVGRGEGCNSILLENATSSEHSIAVLNNGIINQDGRSSGLATPSGYALKCLIKQVVGFVARPIISYAEPHGSGTSLGDALEANALQESLGTRFNPVTVGGIKTNIGYSEGNAGAAGICKILISFIKQYIPRHRNWFKMNRNINVWSFLLPIEGHSENFANNAIVNSSGYSGANGAILVENKSDKNEVNGWSTLSQYVLSISSKSKCALHKQVAVWQTFLRHQLASLPAVMKASCSGNDFTYRKIAIGSNHIELQEQLEKCVAVKNDSETKTKISFLFSGQSKNILSVGRQLCDELPLFRETLSNVAKRFDCSVHNFLENRTIKKTKSNFLSEQQLSFCLELTLAQLWQHWNAKPSMLIPHSLGEIVASNIAGMIDLEDSVSLMSARCTAMKSMKAAMLSVNLSRNMAESLACTTALCWFSAENSHCHCTLTSGRDKFMLFVSFLSELGFHYKLLNEHGLHNPMMRMVAQKFYSSIETISFERPKITYFSSVTGNELQILDASYWYRQLVQPANFAASIRAAINHGTNSYLEVGPSTGLLEFAAEGLSHSTNLSLMSSLRWDQTDLKNMLQAAGHFYLLGHSIAWNHIYPCPYIWNVPNYSFEEHCYKLEAEHIATHEYEIRGLSDTDSFVDQAGMGDHPLLGRPLIFKPGVYARFQQSFLQIKHKSHFFTINDQKIVSYGTLIEIAIAAFQSLSGTTRVCLNFTDVHLSHYLSVNSDGGMLIETEIIQNDANTYTILLLTSHNEIAMKANIIITKNMTLANENNNHGICTPSHSEDQLVKDVLKPIGSDYVQLSQYVDEIKYNQYMAVTKLKPVKPTDCIAAILNSLTLGLYCQYGSEKYFLLEAFDSLMIDLTFSVNQILMTIIENNTDNCSVVLSKSSIINANSGNVFCQIRGLTFKIISAGMDTEPIRLNESVHDAATLNSMSKLE